MVLLRFFSVSVISFLLLSPLVRQTEKQLEKPTVILGIDNSKSLGLNSDSEYYRHTFPNRINLLVASLQKKCDVRIYSFDDKLTRGFTAGFTGARTNISLFFNEVNTRFTNRNAAAVILATDGIYNEGTDPYYAAQKIPFPVYTIALGDTILKKDIFIRKILVNKTAYRGDKFPVEVMVEMDKCNGLKSRLSISRGDHIIETKEIKANSDRSLQKTTFFLDASETGMIRYSLHLDDLQGEAGKQNNHAEFMVEVLEARQKIAMITGSPHPDVTAIEKALEGSSHFEIELLSADALPATYDKYDLVILNQMPSIVNIADFSSLLKSKVSLLFIIGPQTDINSFNKLKSGLIINSEKNAFTESQPSVNADFSLFTFGSTEQAVFREFPPLQSPFGSYQVSPMAEVLFYQKIGNVSTRIPLILFTRAVDRKIGVITGENIWRWRIADFLQHANHEIFDQWVDKIAQYLSVKEDKSFFRVRYKNKIYENDPLEMEAELFNASYELINQPDVNITITDGENKSYPLIFSRTQKAYYLNAGLFPVGEYSYVAQAKEGVNQYRRSGKFFIEKVNLENMNLMADHHLLSRIAASHDGELIFPENMDKIADKILARQDIRSVTTYQKRMSDLVGNPWLFTLIILLVAAEWVIRKREGL